ncbi:gamma carbonic anhydrase family protein [Pedococcus aerophilus]|uniref:Gamma carbonic anhydrase family protein n=1 Tax=Pedococcus aerophilus TaxID=436356 RepID=A0ABP6GYI2_9MICO
MLIPLGERTPRIHPSAWIADNATVVGATTMAEDSSVWFSAVVRADGDCITIGPRSNVQDGCVLHADRGIPLRLGAGVTVGHGAVLHGCLIDDDVLVGMGAIVLNGASIGSGSIIGAGAMIPEGTQIPPNSMVLGLPGKVRRETTDAEHEGIRANAQFYVERIAEYTTEIS